MVAKNRGTVLLQKMEFAANNFCNKYVHLEKNKRGILFTKTVVFVKTKA